MAGSSGAHVIRCAGCGSAFALDQLTPQVSCPYCGHQQAATSRYDELHGYQRSVADRLQSAGEDQGRVAQAAAYQPAKNAAIAVGLVAGVPIVLALGAVALWLAGVLSQDSLGPALGVVVVAGPCLGMLGYLLWYIFRSTGKRDVAEARPGQIAIACPECGAPGSLTVGQALDRCVYCGSSLVPSTKVVQRGLDAAWEAHRRARIQRYRAERRVVTQAKAAEDPISSAMGYVVLGFPVIVFGVIAIAITVQMATGEEPFHWAIFLLWGFVGVCGAGFLAYHRHRRHKLRGWRLALGNLAQQFGGGVYTHLTERIQWLDAYWASSLPAAEIYQTPYGHAARLDACGYPALVIADPTGDRYRPRRLEIFVGAWVVGLSDGTGRTNEPTGQGASALAWVKSKGFDLGITEGGLRARASTSMVAQLHRDPSAAHALAPVVSAMASVAASIGAQPIAPIA